MRTTDRTTRLRRPLRARPHLETLEDRTLLSVAFNPDATNRNVTAGFAFNQVQTTIAVNPNSSNQLFAASNPWVFRYSTDGGVTWNSSDQTGLPAGGDDYQASWDRHGNLFVAYINQARTAAVVVRSINGGQSFNNWTLMAGTGVDGTSIDTGPGAAGSGYSDTVCVAYREISEVTSIGARCAGVSGLGTPATIGWTSFRRAPGSNGGFSSDIAIRDTGAVLVTYRAPYLPPEARIGVNTDANGLLLAPDFGPAATASFSNVNVAAIPAQANVGVDTNPNLDCHHASGWCYLVYVDSPNPFSDDTDIYLRKSFNGGAWSNRVRVNNDVAPRSQFHPAIDVDQTTGNVGITWLDARVSGPANNMVSVYGTVQYYRNDWFWPSYRIGNADSNCNLNSTSNCGLNDTGAFHNGRLYRSWADNSLPSALTPPNANNPANSQDLAMNRVFVDDSDPGHTTATAYVTSMGPGPCEFFHIDEPLGNRDGLGTNEGLRDVDLYRFTANAGTTLTARTSAPVGGIVMDTALGLYTSGSILLASNNDDEPGADHYSRITYTFTASGTYYLSVRGATDGDIGDYHLDLSLTATPDVGDTAAAALLTGMGPLNVSYGRACEVLGNGAQGRRDVDLYRIEATAGLVLTAATFRPTGGDIADTRLRIFNASLSLVASDDDSGPGDYSLVNYIVSATGTYYVGVSAGPNSGYNPTVAGSGVVGNERLHLGDYQLYVGVMAQADIGDTLAAALITGLGPLGGSYQLGGEVIGNGTHNTMDVDLFRFTANAGMRLTARTSLPPLANVPADTYLRLFNSAGTQIASNNDCPAPASPYACLLNFRIPAGGTYYLGVTGSPNSGYNPTVGGSGVDGVVGDYRLNLSLVPGAAVGFQVTASAASVTAGTPFSVTVRAVDDGGNTATGFTGLVRFSSSDPVATLPPDYNFVPGDQGVHTFTNGVTLYVAGSQSVRAYLADNPTIDGTVNVTVNPGPVTYYWIYPGSELATSVVQSVPLDIYIFPFDLYFNWITDYRGTITFYTPDPRGVVPANYTFTGLEGGIGVPGTVTFGTLGTQELYCWDTATVSAFGYAAYSVLAPSGPAPGDGVADLLAEVAQPVGAVAAARLDRQESPRLDAASVELLFARPRPVAAPEGSGQLAQQHRPAPVAERWSTLVQDETFQAV